MLLTGMEFLNIKIDHMQHNHQEKEETNRTAVFVAYGGIAMFGIIMLASFWKIIIPLAAGFTLAALMFDKRS